MASQAPRMPLGEAAGIRDGTLNGCPRVPTPHPLPGIPLDRFILTTDGSVVVSRAICSKTTNLQVAETTPRWAGDRGTLARFRRMEAFLI